MVWNLTEADAALEGSLEVDHPDPRPSHHQPSRLYLTTLEKNPGLLTSKVKSHKNHHNLHHPKNPPKTTHRQPNTHQELSQQHNSTTPSEDNVSANFLHHQQHRLQQTGKTVRWYLYTIPSGLESEFQITYFPTSKQQYQPSARVGTNTDRQAFQAQRPCSPSSSGLNRSLNSF